MTSESLEAGWLRAASLLGIEVLVPYAVALPAAGPVFAAALVNSFGAERGMLILTDYAQVRGHLAKLERAGFGFSVLSVPRQPPPFSLDAYIDVLRDWGWAGSAKDRPHWLQAPRRRAPRTPM